MNIDSGTTLRDLYKVDMIEDGLFLSLRQSGMDTVGEVLSYVELYELLESKGLGNFVSFLRKSTESVDSSEHPISSQPANAGGEESAETAVAGVLPSAAAESSEAEEEAVPSLPDSEECSVDEPAGVVDERIQGIYEEMWNKYGGRSRNVIRTYLPTYLHLMPYVDGEKTEFNFPGAGPRAIYDMKDLLDRFRAYDFSAAPEASEADTEAAESQEDVYVHEEDNITDNQKVMIEYVLNDLLARRGVRCRNAFNNQIGGYRSLLKYEGCEDNFRRLRNVGKECAEELTGLLCEFRKEYDKIFASDDKAVKKAIIHHEFPFLDEGAVSHVSDFHARHGHYPMFFILCYYLRTSSNRNAMIRSMIYGLHDDNKIWSRYSVAAKLGLDAESIRNVIRDRNFTHELDIANMLSNVSWWSSYCIMPKEYMSRESSDYERICEEERVDMSFYSYCHLLGLFHDVKMIHVSEEGKVLQKSNEVEGFQKEGKNFNTYVCALRFANFSFGPAMREIANLVKQQKVAEDRVPLNTQFICNPEYWPSSQPLEGEKSQGLLELLEKMITDVYGDCVVNHVLILSSNKTDYGNLIYSIIRQYGTPEITLEEIFRHYREIMPDGKYDSPDSLRPYIIKDERIQCVGRTSTYVLAESDRYTGSLVELAVKLAAESREPVAINDLARAMQEHRPQSSLSSMKSTVYQCLREGKLIRINDNCVGVGNSPFGEILR